jgi:alpha/beta superfamily hydrolase
MYPQGNLFIPAPHGHLEAIYRPDDDQASRAAVVLHPHPQFGGTMHNKVVYRAAKALERSGYAVLRFNYRGVGQSTGRYDDAKGEADDARVALDYLLDHQTKAREVVVAGFSFGAAIALRIGCPDARVGRVISIGTPLRSADIDDLRKILIECHKPILYVHGAEDKMAPLAPVRELLDSLPAGLDYRLAVIPGASHFFDERLTELQSEIISFLEASQGPL